MAPGAVASNPTGRGRNRRSARTPAARALRPAARTTGPAMTRLIDITGKRLGRWTVLAIHPERSPGGEAVWICYCDCGTKRDVTGHSLRSGNSTNCGCLRRENLRKRRTRHGHCSGGRSTLAYTRWLAMLQRCFDPNHERYCYYGGRGVTVCDRWLKFENFYVDMDDPPPGQWLDRRDNDGNYEPGNCRWTTPTEQARNRRPPKRKRRRSSLAEIQAYGAALAPAASAPGGVGGAL
jgi:hypothetical protein